MRSVNKSAGGDKPFRKTGGCPMGKVGDGQAKAALNTAQDQVIPVEDARVLYEQVERNRAILDAAVDAIVTIDENGVIVSSNPATERIFGYCENELLGRNVKMLMPTPYREEHDDYLARYRKTGEAHVIGIGREVKGRRKDGSIFPVDLAVGRVDHLGFYIGIMRDISARKQIEESARRDHEFAERLLATVQNIILVLDCEGRIVRYNSFFEQISGVALEEVEGADWFDTFLPESDRVRIRELFQQSAVSDAVRGSINSIVTKSGERREIEWYASPLCENDGSVIALVCCGTDVTERLRLEREVYRASEEERIRIAQDLHDGLGSFLTGIGYLAGALSANLRHGKEVSAEDTDLIVENINDAIHQARALARGLHGISDQPNGLHGALKKLVAWVRTTTKIKCRFSASDSYIAIADSIVANHVYRIAQEAVNNAVRHSGATQLTLRIETAADNGLVLSVLDNGCGFDPATLPDRGIGLHTMKYRSKAIGARLSITRRKSGGTRVKCHFCGS